MASNGGNTHQHSFDALAGEGAGQLIDILRPAQASDHAVAELANALKPFPRSNRPRFTPDGTLTPSQAKGPLRSWGGDRKKCVSAPFPFVHRASPIVGFFVVANENHNDGSRPSVRQSVREA